MDKKNMHLFCDQGLEGEIQATKQELDDTKAVSTDIKKGKLVSYQLEI